MSMMDIEKRIGDNAALVESALTAHAAQTDPDFAPVQEAAAYSLLAPRAKRIRPTLVFELCRMLGGKDEAALPCAMAVEMVHTYSLIHDDLPCMDNDDLRRGRPTCHKVFGEATALLAGDALLTEAFLVLANASALDAFAVRDAVAVLSRAAGSFGMIGGQIMDMMGETQKLSLPLLNKLHENKTGALIAASATLGCIAAGLALDDPRVLAVQQYAKGIGLAFQIVDDVLDVTADAETAGKSVGSDVNKTTFMTYYTPTEALALARRITEEAKDAIRTLENNDVLLALADYLILRKC